MSEQDRREYLASIGDLTLYVVLNPPDTADDTDPSCITPHSHPYCELFVCGRGTVTLQTSGGPLQLSAGDAVIIPAQCAHRKTAVTPDTEWYSVGYLCSRRPCHDTDSLYDLAEGKDNAPLLRKYMNVPQVFVDVKRLFSHPKEISKYVPVSELFVILVQLKQTVSLDLEIDGERNVPHNRSEMISLLTYLDHFVYQRFAEPISEREIAQKLFISERQLGRIANKRYGMPLHRAIINKRVETAAELLRSTEKTVSEIGREVGFNSGTCFYREFSARFGTTPKEYRENK